MDPQSLAELREVLSGPVVADDDGVWPEHMPIVEAFMSVASQWRVVSIGGGMAPAMPHFIGLDYAAVRAALDAEQIVVTPDLWRGLRVMENAARIALNEAD